MTRYNFDKITNRKGTNCLKYDFAVERGKPADVLPLWVADMDFPVSEEISKSLHAAVEHGIYGYTQPKDAYYNAVMNWMERKHNWKTKREWIVKTPGVVFALGAAVKAFTDPGDAILIQNPVYYPFTNIIRDNNRKVVDNTLVYHPVTERTVVPVTTDDASEQQINNVGTVSPAYQIDFQDFERKIEQEHVKLFILCNPHNPVGRVWTVEELQQFHHLGFDYLTIGVESGDSETLTRVNKGYLSEDIVEQCRKLEEADIHYHFFYLVGLGGHGNGERNALRSAGVFNQLHPVSIGFLSLTLFPESQLYQEIQEGKFEEATEHERFDEMITLIEHLHIQTHILGRTVSNPVPFTGSLPHDRISLLQKLRDAKVKLSEERLRSYRDSIESL